MKMQGQSKSGSRRSTRTRSRSRSPSVILNGIKKLSEKRANNSHEPSLDERTVSELDMATDTAGFISSTKVISAWCHLVSRYVAIIHARKGELEKLKSVVGKCRSYMDPENLARAACRFRREQVLDYVFDTFKIDPDKENSVGLSLMFFSVFSIKGHDNHMERTDHGQVLKLLAEKYKGNVHHIHSATNQITVLFHAARNPDGKALSIIRYLVEKHKVNLRHRDIYGATVLHYAAMANNTKTVEYIIKKAGFHSECGNWLAVVDSELFTWLKEHCPEISFLQSWWERQGILDMCKRLSPMGVALVHNNKKLAARLYGVGCSGVLKTEAKRRMDALFEDSYRDFNLLCKACPKSVNFLLDYFVKVDESHASGFDQTIFDIRCLYGFCTKATYQTPLAVLIQTDNVEAFDHKAIKMAVALKWEAFGKKYCRIEFIAFVIILVSFSLGFIFDSIFPIELVDTMRLVSAMMAVYFLRIEVREAMAASSFKVYIYDFWNILSLTTHSVILALFFLGLADFCTPGGIPSFEIRKRLLSGPAALLLIISFAQHFKVAPKVSKFIVLIKLMLKETVQWCVLLALFLAAFSTCFYAMLNNNYNSPSVDKFDTFGDSVLYAIEAFSTSERAEVFSEEPSLQSLATFVHIVATVLVPVIYLNILIAIMTERYEEVSAVSEMRSVMELAEILLGWESILTSKQRQEHWEAISPGPEDPDPREIEFQLGLGAEKFSGLIKNGKVTIVQPSGNEFMDIHQNGQAILLDLRESNNELRDSLNLQEKRILTLVKQLQKFLKVTGKLIRSNVPQNTVLGIELPENQRTVGFLSSKRNSLNSPKEDCGVEEENIEHWKREYLEIEKKQLQKNSASQIQALFRGWQTRAHLRAEYVAQVSCDTYHSMQLVKNRSTRGKF